MLSSRLLAVFLALAVLVMFAGKARSNELPCPSKRHSCVMIKTAIATVGEDFIVAKARSCGWSDQDIEETKRRCRLRK
jgi:hypothetical protein